MALTGSRAAFDNFIGGVWSALAARPNPSPDGRVDYPFAIRDDFDGVFSATGDGFWHLVINRSFKQHIEGQEEAFELINIKLPNTNGAILRQTSLVNLVATALMLDGWDIDLS
ncbi:MAG: hypothetical protein ACKVOE_04670 [Rickettsiales bacterium]